MAIDVTAGSSTAVAYGSAAEADAYFTARGITTWTGTDAAKEAALINGCDYLERRYRGKWEGRKATDDQSLAWPRSWLSDVDGYPVDATTVPEQVKRANFEAALLDLTGTDLEPVVKLGGAIKRKRLKAGSAEVETEYAGTADARDKITAIDGLLVGFVKTSGAMLLRV